MGFTDIFSMVGAAVGSIVPGAGTAAGAAAGAAVGSIFDSIDSSLTPHQQIRQIENTTISQIQDMGFVYPLTDCNLIVYLADRGVIDKANKRRSDCADGVHSGAYVAWFDVGENVDLMRQKASALLNAVQQYVNSHSASSGGSHNYNASAGNNVSYAGYYPAQVSRVSTTDGLRLSTLLFVVAAFYLMKGK